MQCYYRMLNVIISFAAFGLSLSRIYLYPPSMQGQIAENLWRKLLGFEKFVVDLHCIPPYKSP